MKLKASEVFEGENSSLRKTFDAAVRWENSIALGRSGKMIDGVIYFDDGDTRDVYAEIREDVKRDKLWYKIINFFKTLWPTI